MRKSTSQNNLTKYLALILLSTFITLGTIGGCNNSSTVVGTQTITENDIASDANLSADSENGAIAILLEHPDTEEVTNDTNGIGVDEIPIKYRKTVEQTFCWEDGDPDAMHFMELTDSQGSEVMRVEANSGCVSEVVPAGDYVMIFTHDGRVERSFPIFMVPDEDTEQAKTEGLINGFIATASNFLKGISDSVTKDAEAQSVQDNIIRLLLTNQCVGCDLTGANLIDWDLDEANLTDANLTRANLSLSELRDAIFVRAILVEAIMEDTLGREANLQDANLTDANFRDADFPRANLRGANMTRTEVLFSFFDEVDFTNANLSEAILARSEFTDSIFINADMQEARLPLALMLNANLTNANLQLAKLDGGDFQNAILVDANFQLADLGNGNFMGADVTGADFSDARRCRLCRCAPDSIGECIGCTPLDQSCSGTFGTTEGN